MSKICLKDAFRYQNKFKSLLKGVASILSSTSNVTKTEVTFYRNAVCKDAADEVVVTENPNPDYADKINSLIDFTTWLMENKKKLSDLIFEYKKTSSFDFDGEISLNKDRQDLAEIMSRLSALRSSERISKNAGSGYTFNVNGDQVMYRCDMKQVTTINYDRNKTRKLEKALLKDSDAISSTIDRYMVEPVIEYTPEIDVLNLSLLEAFEEYCQLVSK